MSRHPLTTHHPCHITQIKEHHMKPRNATGSALGTYSKGNEYSLSINFGLSGGIDCSTGCVHHPESTVEGAPMDCYAARSELRFDRKPLRSKLERHEKMGPAQVCGMALLELKEHIRKGKRIDWLRVSTNGAVPEWDSPRCTGLFKSQFRALLMYAASQGIPIHFPVETWDKAEGYRTLVGGVTAVRESVHSEEDFINRKGACSTSTGAGLPMLKRIEAAKDLAKARYEATGRSTIVCPAVTSSFKHKLCRDPQDKPRLKALADKSKCGNCTACANGSIDIVYPAH
jgi:hypothetical protein